MKDLKTEKSRSRKIQNQSQSIMSLGAVPSNPFLKKTQTEEEEEEKEGRERKGRRKNMKE